MARARKQFPLRIAPELYDAYERWAADEFRSVNAQIESALMDAARRAGRLRATSENQDAGSTGETQKRRPDPDL